MNEQELEERAAQELLREAKRGKERAQTMGTSGWKKSTIPKTNKQFLHRTLASVSHSHRVASNKKDAQKKKTKEGLEENTQKEKKMDQMMKQHVRSKLDKTERSKPYDKREKPRKEKKRE
ncbi:uncharacterized protein LOC104265467 [Ciona intestinalis]